MLNLHIASTSPHSIPTFLPLTGIYEPSSILQLADGRFLVVEDKKSHPFSLVTIQADGHVSSTSLSPAVQGTAGFHKLDDLEGAALDQSGFIYAITSHSRDGDGDKKSSRDKLVRFRIEGEHIVEAGVIKSLKPALLAAHPVLATAAMIRDVKKDGGLNIEALAFDLNRQGLLVGFRSPLRDERALIARVENPAAMFDADAPPRIAPALMTLDLGGYGIRGMAYLPAFDGYLVIAGPASTRPVQFQLRFWSGDPDAPARRASVAGLPGFEHAEGITPAVLDGLPRILIVSDDGSRKKDRFARFMLLDPDQLQIA